MTGAISAFGTKPGEQQVGALVISADPFFMTRRAQIVALAANRKMLVMYPFREFVDDGGLMSYGPSLANAYHEAGVYAGRVLNGPNPANCRLKGRQRLSFSSISKLQKCSA